jgi:protein-S-isoprenylcysteine O-methyltransferase Ste14
MDYCILASGWLIFCLLHSVLASEKSKAFFGDRMGSNYKYYRLIYSVVALVTLGAVLAWQFSIHPFYLGINPYFKFIVAIPVGMVGAILMGASIRKYFYKLSGVEVFYHQPGPSVLETRGVHKIVRHPLYAGTLLVLWAIFLWFPTLANLIACVMITAYVRIGIVFEERKLTKMFGSQYEVYKRGTPMLFPYIMRRMDAKNITREVDHPI